MPAEQLRNYLDSQQVKYVSIRHSKAYTAQEVAASAHISGREMAKTVIVRLGEQLAMCVLPANEKIDLEALKKASGAKMAALADEHEFAQLFPDCEIGAMPPFGNLYKMPVYVWKDFSEDEEIAFNAGSHTELFRMAYRDFARLVNPTIVDPKA
jgi:Ala-tRNA(Pro) deacylase